MGSLIDHDNVNTKPNEAATRSKRFLGGDLKKGHASPSLNYKSESGRVRGPTVVDSESIEIRLICN